MLVGIYPGDSASASESQSAKYLHVLNATTARPLQSNYLDYTQSWAAGAGSSYTSVCQGAENVLLSIPILWGNTRVATTLNEGTLTEGQTYTSFTVAAISSLGGLSSGVLLPAGQNITFLDGNKWQVWELSAAYSFGQTTMSVVGQAANYAYASPATVITAAATVSPDSPASTSDGIATVMLLTDVAAGVWDHNFEVLFDNIQGSGGSGLAGFATPPNLYLRLAWENYGIPTASGWYPWSGPGAAAALQLAIEHLMTLVPSRITGAASITWDWSGAGYAGAYVPAWSPLTAGYVPSGIGVVSCDLYDQTSPWGATAWATTATEWITPMVEFAQTNDLLAAVDEIGFSSSYNPGVPIVQGDDYLWLMASYWTFRANEGIFAYVILFNNGSLVLSGLPNCAAIFSALFGAWSLLLNGATEYEFLTTTGVETEFV